MNPVPPRMRIFSGLLSRPVSAGHAKSGNAPSPTAPAAAAAESLMKLRRFVPTVDLRVHTFLRAALLRLPRVDHLFLAARENPPTAPSASFWRSASGRV